MILLALFVHLEAEGAVRDFHHSLRPAHITEARDEGERSQLLLMEPTLPLFALAGARPECDFPSVSVDNGPDQLFPLIGRSIITRFGMAREERVPA